MSVEAGTRELRPYAVARITLPEGKHTLHAVGRTAAGAAAGDIELKDVDVKAGRRTFLIVRTAK